MKEGWDRRGESREFIIKVAAIILITLKDIKIAPQLPSGIQKLLWVFFKKKMEECI